MPTVEESYARNRSPPLEEGGEKTSKNNQRIFSFPPSRGGVNGYVMHSVFLPCITLALLTLREGVRQRFLWVSVGVLLLGILLASFARLLAVTEAQEIFNALLAGFLRLMAVLITILYVLNSQAREYQDQGMALLFSLPMARSCYFFGKLAGYVLLTSCMVGLFSLPFLLFGSVAQGSLWGVSLFLELLIVILFSFLVQGTIKTVPAAFVTALLFYLLSRVMASLLVAGHGAILPQDNGYLIFLNTLLQTIAYLLPRLDRFTQVEWVVYGQGGWSDLYFILMQSVGYLCMLCGAVLFDLYRKSI